MRLKKFDYQINDNRKNKSVLFLGIGVLVLVTAFIIYKSFAAYKVTETYNIIKGSVSEFTVEPLKITYNLVGEDGAMMSTSEIPSQTEYEFDSDASSCENGTELIFDKTSNTFTFAEDAEDVCNIYFNYIPLAKQTLYALGLTDADIKTGIPYGINGTNDPGYYAAPDNYGISYYYYNDGSYFAPEILIDGNLWIIVRINGDGSIRLLETSSFYADVYNNSADDNTYVGYFYGDFNSNDYLSTHANNNSSNLYHMASEGYLSSFPSEIIADNIFCNDRTLYKEEYGEAEIDDTFAGAGTNTTYYGAYYRLKYEKPTLVCERKDDSFTMNESEIGNGKNKNNAGYLSADEVYMTNMEASMIFHGGSSMFTMSPAYFKDGKAFVYYSDYEDIYPVEVSNTLSVSHVINIKRGLKFSGDGFNEPYEIVQ